MKILRIEVLKRIKPYALPLKWNILAVVLISALAMPVALISPRFFQILIDEVLAKRNMDQFRIVAAGLLGVYVIRFILDGGSLFFGNRLLNGFTLRLRADVFGKYRAAPFAFMEQKDVGDLKMRVMDDVDSLGSFIQGQVVDFCFAVLMIGFSLWMCVRVNPWLTLCSLAIIPFVFLINHLIGGGTRKVNEDIRRVNEKYYTSTHGSLQFWREMKAQNAEPVFISRFRHYRQLLAKLGLRWVRYWGFSEIFNDFKANYLTYVWVYCLGAFFVIRQEVTVGALMMFAQYFAMLFSSLDTVNGCNVALKTGLPYYRRVFDTLDFPEEPAGKPADLSGNITAENLTFGYRDGQTVLHHVDFSISPGETTAIIGKTGCGKTTLAKLLLGLYKPREGFIAFDGNPIAGIDKENLYGQIGVVMQDSFLFDMTIRENLLLSNAGADEAELASVCRKAAILDFIEGLPDRFDTVVGERGVRLSGGEKQRLCIARALLKKPKIILFDEAASALDAESEAIIDAAIDEIAADTTVIVITHKPAAAMRAKRIVVIEDGRVIGAGTHDELSGQGGLYQAMAEAAEC